MHKRMFHTILFSFGVLMVLLRPFMAYQVSFRTAFGKEPQRVYNLLQKLVTKKNEHQNEQSVDLAVLEQHETKRSPSVSFIIARRKPFGLPLKTLFAKLLLSRPFVETRPNMMTGSFKI